MKRAEEAKDAEGRGGIESVDFLRKIQEYRQANSLTGAPEPWPTGNVWEGNDPSRIRVCVRKRPMLRVETLRHDFDVVTCAPCHSSLVIHEPKTRVDLVKSIDNQRFNFDAVFNEADSNRHVYDAALRPLLAHIFGGGQARTYSVVERA